MGLDVRFIIGNLVQAKDFTHKTHTRHTQDCYKDTHKIVIRMLQRHTQTITKISQTF